MRNCKKCGKEALDTQKFCSNCGEVIKSEVKEIEKREIQEKPKEKPKVKIVAEKNIEKKVEEKAENKKEVKNIKHVFKLDKKILILSAVIVVLIIGLFSVKGILKSKYSAEKVVENFQAAILNNDIEKLKEIIYINKGDVVAEDSTISEYIKVLKDSNMKFKNVISSLNEDMIMVENLSVAGSPILLEDSELFSLTLAKKNILYKQYGIIVNKTNFNTNTDDNIQSDEEVDIEGEINVSTDDTVNKYKDIDFIIETSNTKELSYKDLNKYNSEELLIARNEILARHGYVFKYTPNLQKYFNQKTWYKPDSSYSGESKSEVERLNIGNLKSIEFLKLANTKYPSVSTDYVFENSNLVEIEESEIKNLNDWELIVARNEIFGRYGLEFSTKELIEHFKSKNWFTIDSSVGNDVKLTDIERKNAVKILDEENRRIEEHINNDLED